MSRLLALLLALPLALAIAATPAPVLAQSYSGGGPNGGQTIDDEALAIANQLQCPVCQNVTVAYSGSQLAGQMRQLIHQKLARGQSKDQIIQYFVTRYGEGILENPPKHGLTLLAWLLPVFGLALGLVVLGSVLLSRRERTDAAPAAPLDDEDELLLARALNDLG
ncbi:MAG: cytochrome c-type biogenesis protein [Chloroflexota bacterium]